MTKTHKRKKKERNKNDYQSSDGEPHPSSVKKRIVSRENYESDSLEEEMHSEEDEIPSAQKEAASKNSGSKTDQVARQTLATGGASNNLEVQSCTKIRKAEIM